ncbi:hypothetical protein GIB67_029410 [Kingdonia uniflora]|uniref:Uncharacterized protein n=1 Tax=Kingdonia uniflora TaxID=39325 RepID=A0A7J7NYC7_9MAGN|nr:hypothetical protein GIB67_029410 [Kingdonia uniflora]
MKYTKLLHKSHPQHNLKLVNNETPYMCDGCREIGLVQGTDARDATLIFTRTASPPPPSTIIFTKNATSCFWNKPQESVVATAMHVAVISKDLCTTVPNMGGDIKGFVYHCCRNLPYKIQYDEVELRLSEGLIKVWLVWEEGGA